MIFITLMIIICAQLHAENLGVVGQVYSIAEEDFLVFIKKRITAMQINGEWQALENQFKSNVEKHAIRPMPISQVTHALETRSWLYDPSLTVPYDLTDSAGRIIAKSGTTINPFNLISLHKALVFFDGDDAKQCVWVKELDKKLSGKTKLIMVNGSIANNERFFSKPIYFDQEGKLVTKLSIKHVPAFVQQNGLFLKITEVAI
jgi:conjugal transfer pilus assembly protein TraW